jgi:hypothetical protein
MTWSLPDCWPGPACLLTGFLGNNGKRLPFAIFCQPSLIKRPESGLPGDIFSEDQSRFVNIL